MEPLEIEQNVNKIKELLKSDDFEINNAGIELARTLAEPDVYDKLLDGCGVASLWSLNVHSDFNNYIVCSLLVAADAPELTNLTNLNLTHCKLKNLDLLSNFTNLSELIITDYDLENLDGWGCLANLTNLSKLNIYSDLMTNVDFLAKHTKITDFSFRGGEKLENMDGIANLTNLESLDLYETPFNLIWLDAEETGDEDDAEFEDWPLTDDRLAVWFLYMFGKEHKRAYKGGYNLDAIKKDLDVQGFRHELY